VRKENYEEIQAVHPSDLLRLFESLGLKQQLLSGQLECAVCGDVITADNFRAIARKQGEIIFCCSRAGCSSLFAVESAEEV